MDSKIICIFRKDIYHIYLYYKIIIKNLIYYKKNSHFDALMNIKRKKNLNFEITNLSTRF